MKFRLLTTLSLVPVLIAACAPGTAPVQTSAIQKLVVDPTATLTVSVAPALEQSPQPKASPIQELAPTPFPVATSRGPKLEASDPSTVSMASGGLQFVEFFEFW